MNCPSCGGSKFEKIGNSVYCVTKVNGRLCGATLKGDLRRKYFTQYACKKDRKEYFRKYFNRYYHRNLVKYKEGITIEEIAELKFCERSTVWRNKKKFDVVPGTKPTLIIFNEKVKGWFPNGSKNNNQHQ